MRELTNSSLISTGLAIILFALWVELGVDFGMDYLKCKLGPPVISPSP